MYDLYLRVLNDQVKPATGCTEPVAIALAAARAASLAEGELESFSLTASKGLYKNAYAVGLPGTLEKGIDLAAAIGYAVARPELGMRVLEAATDEDKARARKLVDRNIIHLKYIDNDNAVYVRAEARTDRDQVRVVISGSHDQFVEVWKNGETLLDEGLGSTPEDSLIRMREATVAGIMEFSRKVPLEDLAFLKEGVRMNLAVAEEGLRGEYGLGVGRGLLKMREKGIVCNDLLNQIRIPVAAACDARMGGASLPVMTSCGSGNQGILISIPLAEYCRYYDRKEEDLLRALAMGHLINAYAKAYLGKLSPLCGCSVSAGLGTAAALAWLETRELEKVEGAIKGMLANLTGTLCDGAKATCALKLETAAVEAYTYAMLAAQGVYLRDAQGIVEESCDRSIRNLEAVGRSGMQHMDSTLLTLLETRAEMEKQE